MFTARVQREMQTDARVNGPWTQVMCTSPHYACAFSDRRTIRYDPLVLRALKS